MERMRRLAAAFALTTAFAAAALPAAGAASTLPSRAGLAPPVLEWQDCGDGFQCATARVPRSYAHPRGPKLRLAVVRLPATDPQRRIGSLFVNFGGPGGDAVATLKAIGKDLFATLNDRFDIVGFDPRGAGESQGAIDCKVNQETEGLYAKPFITPENLVVPDWVQRAKDYVEACVRRTRRIAPYASTAAAARDMDLLRAAVGDPKLTYLGFSYGTVLGATYAALFPHRYRALVLDGAVDAAEYFNRPTALGPEQTAGFERALSRFFEACAADQEACLGFGGADPHAAFDELVARADADPLPAGGDDPRPVTGDDILAGSLLALYAKQLWPLFAQALAAAEAGDGTLLRLFADVFYGRLPDGTYDPLSDRFFVLTAAELPWPRGIRSYERAGARSWGMFDHFFMNTGYSELPFGLFPLKAQGVFRGSFRAPSSAPTILVVGTTYDPATPYRQARRLVDELHNARLLTMLGDGHTAYGGNSSCIDAAVDRYLEQGTLPAPGTVCPQEVPFAQPQPETSRAARRASLRSDPRVVWALR